jgi:hypothetical protein
MLESLYLWPDKPLPSLLVLLTLAMPFMYLGREPVHTLLHRISRAIARPLRLGARWLGDAAARLRTRNREVLLAHGSREQRLAIERELERVNTLVQRDLEGYPALQRKLMEEITRIEEDYKRSGEVPPPSPEWVKAIEALAVIKATGDGVVERILGDIRSSLNDIYQKVMAEYRGAYQERHKILSSFLPFWRSVSQTLGQVERNITSLHDSAAKIDANVAKLEGILARRGEIENTLTSSASTQFFISALVMLVAFGGAYVNFKLISLPMSAMVGGGDYVTDTLRASEIAALVIVFFEALMGLFLMESLRFTTLFPFGNITEKMRRRLMWASLAILLVLAGVEVALAVMRDSIIAADVALKQSLGTAAVQVDSGWVTRIPTFGQMILGFTLPFALAFVAIPLEYFVGSGRIVLGASLTLSLRGMAFFLRLAASLSYEAGKLATNFYDVLIFVPLAFERWLHARRGTIQPTNELRPPSAFSEPVTGREEVV